MNRRNFILSLPGLAALPALEIAPAAPKTPRFVLFLEGSDDCYECTAEGPTLRAAIDNLIARVESDTAPIEDYYKEIFYEARAEFESGKDHFKHWDFSSPEEAFTVQLFRMFR